MQGPYFNKSFSLSSDPGELLWVTSFKTALVHADGKTPASPEYLCHANIISETPLNKSLGKNYYPNDKRLFTSTQGQTDVDLPQGFALPIMSDQLLTYSTQVLNLNDDLTDPEIQIKSAILISIIFFMIGSFRFLNLIYKKDRAAYLTGMMDLPNSSS